MRKVATSILLVCVALSSCSSNRSADSIRVVASFYPLAWAAQQLSGGAANVEDLTSAGAEPHDLQLTARQRTQIQNADLVILVGRGFQPEVERAAKDARGQVLDVSVGLGSDLRTAAGKTDPHVWLDPRLMRGIVRQIDVVLGALMEERHLSVRPRLSETDRALVELEVAYKTGLRTCSLDTLVTTHTAFSYLAEFGLHELGLTGLTPEAEPSAREIDRVRALARQGKVAAVFFEATDQGRRIGESVARDVGVKALALNTLESDPKPLDYVTQMRANLAALKDGLRCR